MRKLSRPVFQTDVEVAEISAPSTPSAGYGRLYANGKALYFKDSDGAVRRVDGVSAPGTDREILFNDSGSVAAAGLLYEDVAGGLNLKPIDQTVTDDPGLDFNILGSLGNGTGTGGAIEIAAADSDTGNGGDLTLKSGSSPLGAAGGGTLLVQAGDNGIGGGDLQFRQFDALYRYRSSTSIYSGVLDFSSITTSEKTFTFPNTTGTIALTSNIPTALTQLDTTVTGSQLNSLKTKVDGIEALADVTDATNVDAAGAVMNSDASTASMSFVVDEDTMTSNSATKVPTQQSTKAYVDTGLATKANTSHTHTLSNITDAGTIAGKAGTGFAAITVGTSAPGSPATGDIWIDTN